jgi:hypothetical protein
MCFAVIRHFEGDAEFSQFVGNVPEPGVEKINDGEVNCGKSENQNTINPNHLVRVLHGLVHYRLLLCVNVIWVHLFFLQRLIFRMGKMS